MSMLKIEMIGRIGADAQVKDFNGRRFMAFNLAHSERYKDAQGNQREVTTWVSCLKHIKDGQAVPGVMPFITKGKELYIRGDLQTKIYTDKNGQPQIALNCNVQELTLLGSKNDGQQPGATAGQTATTPGGYAAPTPQGYAQPQPYAGGYAAPTPGGFTPAPQPGEDPHPF